MMNCKPLVCFVTMTSLALLGCNQGDSKPKVDGGKVEASIMDPEVVAALAELPEEDRQVAQSQKFCAVEQKNLLGAMGKPFKVMIEGQSIFLCCEGCQDDAVKDPQATLAKVAALKQANSASK
jgi:hypothetical protein